MSVGSRPAIACRRYAASVTSRAIGPAVSKLCASGMTPVRLTKPTVGLMPTRDSTSLGDRMLPLVSVPIAAAAYASEAPAPDPDDEPLGSPPLYGLTTCPPSEL